MRGRPWPQTCRSRRSATSPRGTRSRSRSGFQGCCTRTTSQTLPFPPPRTKWTRRVPHPVLIGHAASLSQVTLSGDAAASWLASWEGATSTLTLTAAGAVRAGQPQALTVADSNGILYPDGASAAMAPYYGSGFAPALPLLVVAQLTGAGGSRHDNCKGDGCTVATTWALPPVQASSPAAGPLRAPEAGSGQRHRRAPRHPPQPAPLRAAQVSGAPLVVVFWQDGSSMDTVWSGGVQYGGTGGACARPGTLAQESGAAFPLNRECTLFGGANSNAPLTNPTRTRPLTGGAGENGAPIGAETSLAQRAGRLDGQPDACRADAAGLNPCALPIGAAPAVAFALAFSGAAPAAFAQASSLTASARHPRALVPGDTLTLTLPGVTRDGGDLASTGTDLTVTVAGAGAAGWTMAWDAGAAALALTVATQVPPPPPPLPTVAPTHVPTVR